MKFKIILILAIFLCSHNIFRAATNPLDDAKELYLSEKYADALPLFMAQYEKNPKNASLNQWIGVSLVKLDREDEAIKYFEFASSKGITESFRYLSEIKYRSYDFDGAEALIEKYNAALKKTKKNASDEALVYINQFRTARNMIDHVEKIQIIDSLIVDKKQFFTAYKLSPESGSFVSTSALPYEKQKPYSVMFMPESKEQMVWSMKNNEGVAVLTETNKLIDDNWDKYSQLSGDINMNGNAEYPFIMPDGTTLYFASDGDKSIGGKDIFITRKDLETGDYLQPQNIGMPYNSPYDDYLLAIDEYTGVGWWATDRNRIPGKVTIYIYIPSAMRENYAIDDANISSLAAIRSIKDTWKEDANYTALKEEISLLGVEEEKKAKDFIFSVSNGVIYTTLSDFKKATARTLMSKYIKEESSFNQNIARLAQLRREYAKSSTPSKFNSEIKQLEVNIDKQRIALDELANSVRRAEK